MSKHLSNKSSLRRLFTIKTVFLLLISLLMCEMGWSQSYTSREGDSINPQFYLWAGFYYPYINTTLRVDTKNGRGTEIGLEDDFNLEEELVVFRFDGMVRLTENSQLLVIYTGIKRDRRVILEKDIVFGETTYELGSDVEYYFNVDYIGATYRYNFFNERNWSAGLSGGLRGVVINTAIDGQLNDRNFQNEAKYTAPVILLGVHGSAYLTPRLLARYSLEVFYLQISDIKINIIESNASMHYFIFKNVGLGLSYSTNNYRLTNAPLWGDSDGKVDFNFGGMNLSLTSRF